MAIPQLSEERLVEAFQYIDEHGIPHHNQSTTYDVVYNGKKYPPKYVIVVAIHLETGKDIDHTGVVSAEAVKYLKEKGFEVEVKHVKYTLTITKDTFESTDERFTMNDLVLGDNYQPLKVVYEKGNGETIERKRKKGEKRISNKTMPRLLWQIYEKQILALSSQEKAEFKVCRYRLDDKFFIGIFNDIEEFKKHYNAFEHVDLEGEDQTNYIIYCWNIFSTLYFVQECLKRFGEEGDRVVLTYKEKDKILESKEAVEVVLEEVKKEYLNPYSTKLIQSKNIIFRGAPGTGKSYLSKEIAADIVSDGYYDNYEALTPEQKEQVEFVQFHPNYDYSDFVEGLRPCKKEDGSIDFELQAGVFKRFAEKARSNFENSQKSQETIDKEERANYLMKEFFADTNEEKEFKTVNGTVFYITDANESEISISIPDNPTIKYLKLHTEELRMMLEADVQFTKIKDVTHFFNKQYATHAYSYYFALYKEILQYAPLNKLTGEKEELKKYVFIIDEINRGEISKILGELFYSIDPGYRGKAGEVLTQYANMHANPDEKFYIPENLYIIGTMNDIDRSVDTFDFAMRRRFRFIEIKPEERLDMLDGLDNEELKEEAIERMTKLNEAIVAVDDLNENYQIGAAYFLKLKSMTFDELWKDALQPLLQDYIQGMYDEKGIMAQFASAYGYVEGKSDESA